MDARAQLLSRSGAWQDRLPRALATGLPWAGIEQDLVWAPDASGAGGRILVAHDTPALGSEPTLERHFFERVRPFLEQSLARGDRERWPLLVLSLDFKTNEPNTIARCGTSSVATSAS